MTPIFPKVQETETVNTPKARGPIFPDVGSVPNQGIFANPNRPEQSAFWDAIDVMNKNFADVANGSLQFMAQGVQKLGIDTSGFQQNLAQQQAMHQQDYDAAMQNSPVVSTITDIGSKIGAAIATPGTQPLMAAQGANVVARMGQAGLAGGLVGGAQYVPEGAETGRFENAMTGAAWGAGAQGALEGVGKLAQKGASKLFGNQQSVDEAAQAYNQGVRQNPAMATGNEGLQSAEASLANVPFVGTRRAVERQADELTGQIVDQVGNMGATGARAGFGADLSKAVNTSKQALTKEADRLYQKAYNMAESQGVKINLSNTRDYLVNAADDITANLQAGGTIGKKAAALLNEVDSLSAAGRPITKFDAAKMADVTEYTTGIVSPRTLEKLRQNIVKITDDAVGSKTNSGMADTLINLRKAIDEDLMNAAGSDKTVAKAFGEARQFYGESVKPFKDLVSKKGEIIDPDTLLSKLTSTTKPYTAKKIIEGLTPESQKTITQSMVNKVYRTSLETTKEGAEQLNLNSFKVGLNKLNEVVDILPKTEQMKIKGMQKLLSRGEYIIKAAQKEKGSALQTLLGGGLAYGAYASLGTTALLGLATKGLSTLLTSPKTTKALIKLAGGKLAQTGADGVAKSLLKEGIRAGAKLAPAKFGTSGEQEE